MNQRTILERTLEDPYEDDTRRLTDARYVSAFLNDLRDEYQCPTGHDAALAGWAYGHPAVGGSHDKSYREKFILYKRFQKSDLPESVIFPLENALIDYIRDLLPSFTGDKRREKKHERLIGKKSWERILIWLMKQDPPIIPGEIGETWWITFHTPPEVADLIDRLEFLRICHYTNLRATYEKPFQPELPYGRSIFHPLNLHTHLAELKERSPSGKFLKREDYDDDEDYPFNTITWTNNPKS